MHILAVLGLIGLISLGLYVRHLYANRSIHPSSLGRVRGMKVYSENGNYLGIIKEVYLEDHNPRVYGWLISLKRDMRKQVSNKNIVIKQKYVKSIKNIMLIDTKVYEHLEKYQEEIKEK
jgi:sporulation protein YlmC with PRC-barrel domain